MESASTAPSDIEWRRGLAPGLFAGVLALATAWFGLPAVSRVPLGGLLVNLALAWGAYTVIEIGIHRRPAPHTWWVPALAPWLAAAILLRMHLVAMGEELPTWVLASWTLEALAIVLGVATVLAYRHLLDDLASTKTAFACSGALALALSAVFLLLHITMPQPVHGGALAILALTLLIVAGAVAAQHLVLRATRLRAATGGAALAVTASQLLDGVVTYLAVIDPFHLLPQPMTEQVAVSAWLLETTGIGYPLVKWGLAVALAFMLERDWRTSQEPTPKRTGFYLAIIFVGVGPALYSTASLLG